MFGAQYAMRIWLDPDKLTQYQLTLAGRRRLRSARRTRRSRRASSAAPRGARASSSTRPITAQSRLQTPEQFGNILLRINPDGSRVRLRDVARVELGGENYNTSTRFNGKPAAGHGASSPPPAPTRSRPPMR